MSSTRRAEIKTLAIHEVFWGLKFETNAVIGKIGGFRSGTNFAHGCYAFHPLLAEFKLESLLFLLSFYVGSDTRLKEFRNAYLCYIWGPALPQSFAKKFKDGHDIIMNNKKTIQKNNNFEHLSHLGWSSWFQAQLEDIENDSLIPARVTGVRKNYFFINDGKEELLATPAGKLQHDSSSTYPVIGDWVMVRQTAVEHILPRKNTLARGASGMRSRKSGEQREQIIAANLDNVFIVTGLDRDFNLRRIERYLTLVYNCGLNPVIILTKADLHQTPEHFVSETETIAFGVPVHLVSALKSSGLSGLTPYLSHGCTNVMVGSSGTGKSTLINRLCGKTVQVTGEVSTHVGKGTHTTTSRDLIMMPQGGMIIDNPGTREISFWDIDQGVESTFPEIEEMSAQCRFSDCTHTHEPGCRVLQAVMDNELTKARLENYLKMKRELEYIASRKNKSAERVEKERWRDITMKIKDINKKKQR